jgi:hypothetical protein
MAPRLLIEPNAHAGIVVSCRVSIPLRSNKLHALANPFALTGRCGGARRDPNGFGTIADQLSMVRKTLWELDGRTDVLLFHELSTVSDDTVRHSWGLLSKPVLPPAAA